MSLPCSECGEHRWSYYGYCLSLQCAGPLDDPEFPRTAPEEQKWVNKFGATKKRTSAAKPKQPRKGTRRSEELWYEMKGETPPWKQKDDSHS